MGNPRTYQWTSFIENVVDKKARPACKTSPYGDYTRMWNHVIGCFVKLASKAKQLDSFQKWARFPKKRVVIGTRFLKSELAFRRAS